MHVWNINKNYRLQFDLKNLTEIYDAFITNHWFEIEKNPIITVFFFQSFTIKDTYMFKVSMLV